MIYYLCLTISFGIVSCRILKCSVLGTKKLFRKGLRKNGSLSQTIDLGISYRPQISTEKCLVRLWAENLVRNATKWTSFVRRSQMIHIIVRSKDEGKCVMKSIDYPSHFYVGITNGCSNPCFFFDMYLLCWQIWECCTKILTSFWITDQRKDAERRASVGWSPEWPAVGVKWYLWMMSC